MRLEGAIGTTLTALALASTLCLSALAQSPQAPSATAQQSPELPSQPALGGISAYEGLIVQRIDFFNLPATAPEHLLDLIPLKAGSPLVRTEVSQSIQSLFATGRFADIQAEAVRTSDGQVVLTFRVTPNLFVGEIFVEGAPNPPAPNQVVNASKLQLGELFTREKADRALASIKQLMEQNGYHQANISDEEQPQVETQQMNILFRIASGPHARVGHVTVTGQPGFSEGQIQDIAKMHPGNYVTVKLVSRALERLRKKYQKQNRLLAQVAISTRTYRPENNTVDYNFEIEPGPQVRILVEGFKISRSQLKKNVPVYEENALDDDLLNEGRRNLLNYMQDRGYFDAKVTVQKTPATAGEMRVTYDIDSGRPHKLTKLEITGNKSFSEELIRSRMQIQPAGRFLAHGRYSQALLNSDVRNITSNPYRANGFLAVKITPTVEDNYQGRDNELAIVLQIEEGPQTTVGTLQISGNETTKLNTPFPDLNISPGQAFGYSKVNEDREIILNYYFNNGFPNATFESSARRSPDNPLLMNVTYTIRPGDQIIVEHVFTAGLNHTHPFVVQREILMKPGNPLSQIDMLGTQEGLYDLGIFSQVDTAVQNPDSTEREKNVLVTVQEAKRYTFDYGLGLEFSTGQPNTGSGSSPPQGDTGVSPRVSFGITRLNFRGRNQTITLKANVGGLQQRGLLSYQVPRLFNNPNWKFTVSGFYDNTIGVTTFTSQRLEGSVQFEQTINKASIMTYRFTYRRVRASDISDTISQDQIPLLSQPTRVAIPNFSYIRNKRDNDLETTKGNYTTIDGGVADSHFGSETNFGRGLIQNSTYYAFGGKRNSGQRIILARSTRLGVEIPFGTTFMPQPGAPCPDPQPGQPACLPLAERFFTGGGNSHRGFGLNQAGPRDPNTGFPLGGTGLFLNNVEMRLPPPTLPFFQDNLSFAIFEDAGNVFNNVDDLFHNLLRWTQKDPDLCMHAATAKECNYSYISHAIGVGVRYKTPVGPVRFDFGYNLNPPQYPTCSISPQEGQLCPNKDFVPKRLGRFNVFFSIGQTF